MLQRNDIEYWPTHGASVTQPKTLVEQLIQHREHRTQAVLQAVQQGQNTLADIVNSAYPGLNPALMNAAQLSTLAAVVWLIENKQLRGDLTKGLSIQLQAM